MSRENKNGVSEFLSEENLTDAEVCGYRFQPLRQRPVLADRPDGRGEWPWRARKEDSRDAELTKRQPSSATEVGGCSGVGAIKHHHKSR